MGTPVLPSHYVSISSTQRSLVLLNSCLKELFFVGTDLPLYIRKGYIFMNLLNAKWKGKGVGLSAKKSIRLKRLLQVHDTYFTTTVDILQHSEN